MNAQLLPEMEGEHRSRERSQFYTPEWLARRVAHWAMHGERGKLARMFSPCVLEPAAGRGALITAIMGVAPTTHFVAVDIDPENCKALSKLVDGVWCADFLSTWSDRLRAAVNNGGFDLAIMNPPYERNRDVRFIELALTCSDRVVGIFQSRILHSKGRAKFWRHVNIDRMAILSERPHFGGEYSAKTDFVVLELTRRSDARNQGEATPAQVEWWEMR